MRPLSRISGVVKRAASLGILLATATLPPLLFGATPPGTKIANEAVLQFDDSAGDRVRLVSNTVVVTSAFGRTPSVAQFTRLQGSGAATLAETQGPSACEQGGVFTPLPPPLGSDGQPIDTQAPQASDATGVYNADETAFIRVDDGDQNLNPLQRETIRITVSNAATGDRETLSLYETGTNTGIFTGYVPLATASANAGNCVLEGEPNSALVADYRDPADAADVSAAVALVEPLAFVFDSTTGLPVDNATVTLIDVSTGRPAVVYGNDGVSAYPATVVSGAAATDASGLVYASPAGGFRFPVIPPGNYRLDVVPPGGFVAPSSRSIAQLNALPGGPFNLTDASFGNAFARADQPQPLADVPIDPAAGGLFLSKTTRTTVAAPGDFVRYSLVAENSSERGAATDVRIRDELPTGFRVVPGSVWIDGARGPDPAPVGPGAGTVEFMLPDIPPSGRVELAYVVELTGGVRGRRAVNRATAFAGNGAVSNEASIAVALREDLFRSRSTLIGRVVEGDCAAAAFGEEAGVAGVRVYLEDGRYAVTDDGGRYHLEGVEPGAHVVQLDPETVPAWFELAACDTAPRFAGRADSQIVDPQAGMIARADFYVRRKLAPTGNVRLRLENESGPAPDTIDYELRLEGHGAVEVSGLSATVLLPDAVRLRAQTVRVDGRATTAPHAAGNALVFVLGERSGRWTTSIRFTGDVDKSFGGELQTRAVANFDTPAADNVRTPVGEARMQREAATFENEDYVLSLRFDVLSAELSAADRAELDALIDAWRGVYDIEIRAVGHSDSDRIAPRNRARFADNYALSDARASAAARYIAAALGVPDASVHTEGRGPDQPVASNDTPSGKQRNRRVEIVMSGTRPGRQSAIEVTQGSSGILETQTTGAVPGPRQTADPLEERIAVANAPVRSPDLPMPDIGSVAPGPAWLVPAAGHQPAIPSVSVALSHPPGGRVALTLNGEPVSPLNFEGATVNADRSVAMSTWRGIDLVEGVNVLRADIIDADGGLIESLVRRVHYAGAPVRGELLAERSRLVADGRRRPVVAVRLFDEDGEPARAASIGGFRVNPPYRSWLEVTQEKENRLVSLGEKEPFYRVGEDGIAYIELEPTTVAGEVILTLKFENEREQVVRAWLNPAPRDWIMVGIAEGTVGYNTIRDNVIAADAPEAFYQDGRVAFFAKGRIRGEYLLTLAWDTRGRAVDRDAFGTEVDPDALFTLYGDGTESRFEAPSQRKLYLKLERRQFVALFGDFDTGLSVTELARYERRFNGFKSEYHGSRFGYTAFAARSDQAFRREDLPGDGTSGLYRLSGGDLVVNSERVRIETRDRFNASVVLRSDTLTRYTDYDIDYLRGTLFFKRPVASRDAEFNPQVIVVEYETRGRNSEQTTAGGRASVRALGGRLELGATVISEGTGTGDGNELAGADLRWQLDEATLLTAEYVDTARNEPASTDAGYAYLVELEHRNGALDARARHIVSDSGFGLGQQAGNQVGIEQTTVETRWQLNDLWRIEGEVGRQRNLDNGAERRLADTEVRYENAGRAAYAGLLYADDSASDGANKTSTQLVAGVSQRVLDDTVTLRASLQQPLGEDENLDYPSRSVVGIDWDIASAVSAFAEYERASGADIEAQMTRVGIRATPWQRAQFQTTLDNEITEFGPRLFANLGFIQGWQLNERWTLDFGLDHSNTILGDDARILDPQRSLASGSLGSDFVASHVGALYQADAWSANARGELRDADDERRRTLLIGWYREPVIGHAFSAGFEYRDSDRTAEGAERRADARLGWAYRKSDRRWAFLDRLDLILDERVAGNVSEESWRIVNNFNAVRRLGAGSELALQYASKFVRSNFDGIVYRGYTDLTGISYRHSWRPRWDFGIHGSAYHSWQSDVVDYGLGGDIGFNPRDNLWLSVGYNVIGFRDPDFDNARYTAAGPYVRVIYKADQHTMRSIAGLLRRR